MMQQSGTQNLLVTGGCRSGKSRFAEEWAETRAVKRLFLATAQILDNEMAERVRRHQAIREKGWITVEEPLEVTKVILEQGSDVEVILLDCVTLWINNLLMEEFADQEIEDKVRELVAGLAQVSCSVGLVTNEVGWGIVPEHPLGRRFRDLAGATNRILAKTVDRVVLMVAGIPIIIKG